MATILATARVTPEALNALAEWRGWADFGEIDPALKAFEGLANGWCIASDGEWAVLVDPQGYPYPRYMTPRIHLGLLLADLPNRIDPPGTNMRAPLNVRLLFVRKSRFLAGFGVNAANLADVLARGIYAFTAIPALIEPMPDGGPMPE